MPFFTVGHSTRTPDEFLALLTAHGIRCVVDVRRFPGSRRHPHFGAEPLAAALAGQGIEYVHEVALGGRRAPVPDSLNTAWRSASFRAYADQMGEPEWQAALDRLLARGPAEAVALMCAEAVPWRCHRQLIADALVARGIAVHHILAVERADPHVLNPHAVVGRGARVYYPGEGALQQDLL